MLKREFWLSFSIFMAVLACSLLIFDYRFNYFVAIALYFLIYFLVANVILADGSKTSTDPQSQEWPTSGPIGRFGQRGLILTFSLSGLLSFFNPFLLVQIVAQSIGNTNLRIRSYDTKDSAIPYVNKVEYALPFSGEWFVYNGGTTPDDSHSWDTLTQRYAYDFVIVDDQLRRHVSTGTDLEDYYCYGKEILAVADGKVVKVVDEIRAAPFVGYGIVDFMTRNFIGNHIIIQHAESEYALYAHLIKGAIVVKIGDPVKQGQVIGRCGHSGHSSEPHLHFHLQDRMNFYLALGLPIRFSNIIVNGKTAEGTNIRAGHHVQNPATYHHSLCEHSHG